MSSVDLSDPHITVAYDALHRNDSLRWFLLAYGNKPNVLSLCASGTGDLDELRSYMPPGNACYGLFREQDQDQYLHVSLTYIPDSVKGVWRARALVHGKAVSSKFKTNQVLHVSSPDQVTIQALRTVLGLPPRGSQAASTTRTFSVRRKLAPDMRLDPLLPSTSETGSGSPTEVDYSRSVPSPPATSLRIDTRASPTSPVFVPYMEGSSPSSPARFVAHTTSLRTTKTTDLPSESVIRQFPLPPAHKTSPLPMIPAPGGVPARPTTRLPSYASLLAKQESRLPSPPPESTIEPQDAEQGSINSDGSVPMGSIPDSQSAASHYLSSRPHSPTSVSAILSHSPVDGSFMPPSEPMPGDANGEPPMVTSPSTVAWRDNEWPRSQEGTKEEPASPLSEQRLHKLQDRAIFTADMEEERKLAVLEEERRRRAAERARREKEEREAEEVREREFEERKERDKQRRLESAKKAEERRIEQKRQQEEEEARRKLEKEQKEIEAQQKRNRIKQHFEKQTTGMDLLSGFITLESASSWKRRYYRLSTEDWAFFKNDEETTTPMHVIELSRVHALREWQEGYEQLEAIPHSFAVELEDDAPWLFFADSAEDKEIIMGLLNQGAGL